MPKQTSISTSNVFRSQAINASSVFTRLQPLITPAAPATTRMSRDLCFRYTRSSTAAKTFATPSCLERDMTPPSPAAAAAGAALLQDVFPGLPLQSSATDLCVSLLLLLLLLRQRCMRVIVACVRTRWSRDRAR
jgi:hypothetical protein